ncbi:hypothetical protein CBR_g27899 [Chara braunii]|uniref:Phosphatidic acid phosphatase type 2/haloperoxidase domain-containing protein n=1 Tax=Chara braunii TaxID=69332 RepID=A0A388L8P7_CHABU|nr:hypothetical protein CBR_g27899 [Chara braunii]|eukprot:GBG78676.1 hypothetical protein CBR_g27899 [Chara braunii]
MGLGEEGWGWWVGDVVALRSRSSAEDSRTRGQFSAGLSFAALLPTMPFWQVATLVSLTGFLYVARTSLLCLRLRKILQPIAFKYVQSGTSTVLAIQAYRHPLLDVIMCNLSVVVSAEFYTAIVPPLMWDVVSAPRPPCPPVKRLAVLSNDKVDAEEYGLPSGHTVNFLAMSLFSMHYLSGRGVGLLSSSTVIYMAVVLTVLMVAVAYGRLYLGMHSPLDVAVGAVIGVAIALVWCNVGIHIQGWIISGTNVIPFQVCLAVLLLNMYPAPEFWTPSFDYHTACTGVVTGMVCGCSMMYSRYHSEMISTATSFSWKYAQIVIARLAVGYPAILLAKSLSKGIAKKVLPMAARFFGLPVYSSEYIFELQYRRSCDSCPPLYSSPKSRKFVDADAQEKWHKARNYRNYINRQTLGEPGKGIDLLASEERNGKAVEHREPTLTARANRQKGNRCRETEGQGARSRVECMSTGIRHLKPARVEVGELKDGTGSTNGVNGRLSKDSNDLFDVDVGVRLVSYAGMTLALERIVPLLFVSLGL